jgi:5'-nucleotidase
MQIEWATPTIARMKILVTNDDGVDNPGIWALVNAVKDLGKVTVVGPAGNQSGVGTALSLRKSVHVASAPSLVSGVECFAVSGTPADSVILGVEHVLKGEVDAVVSGINPGFNTSRNLFISGTMGAAIQASGKGTKACAFSMDAVDDINDQNVRNVTTEIVRELIHKDTPRAALFNVNFPSLVYGGMQGVEGAVPAPSEFSSQVEVQGDGGFEIFSGLRVAIEQLELTDGTDLEVLNRRKVAISALDGPTLTHLPNDPTLRRMIDAANRVTG